MPFLVLQCCQLFSWSKFWSEWKQPEVLHALVMFSWWRTKTVTSKSNFLVREVLCTPHPASSNVSILFNQSTLIKAKKVLLVQVG